jgi:hypothetical protein
MESDQQYFWRRHKEQTAAAERATNDRARVAHLELAARYAQLAAAIGEVDERLGSAGPEGLKQQRPTWAGRGDSGPQIPA